MRLSVAFAPLLVAVAACFPAKTPTQQEADAAALANCVAANWGQPVPVVAAACTQDSVTVAEDIIADLEAALEKTNPNAAASFPYASNSDVVAKVKMKVGGAK